MQEIINYKGYVIDNGVTYENLITVQIWNGDDIIFESVVLFILYKSRKI